jgi:glycosyltransferase involved in cell wall biosynthesis
VCYITIFYIFITMSLVSVIISTKDNFDSLLLAIQSVLNQTYKNIEIIIVNSCSSDPNYYSGKLEDLPHTNVIHISNNLDSDIYSFIEQQKLKEIGAKTAKREWICFLEDTDYWYPNKIQTQLSELSKHPNVLLSSSTVHIGNGLYSPSNPVNTSFQLKSLSTVYTKSLGHSNYIYGSSVILHSSISTYLHNWMDLLGHTDCLYLSTPLLYKSVRM